MALVAGNPFVSAGQREAGRGVVECRKLVPRTHDVADFAAHFEPASLRMHPLRKLSLMRVKVARLATQVGEMVCRHVFPVRQDLVALATTDGYVAALKRELGVAMARQGEIGRRPTFYGMAVLAAVLMGQAGELGLMSVHVAIHAHLELHAVLRRFAGWTMALIASHGGMLSRKRISALGVGGDGIRGWLPAFQVVATGAFALVGSLGKLSAMDVLVAVLAQLVRYRQLEIGGLVTFGAGYGGVLAQQRELCL